MTYFQARQTFPLYGIARFYCFTCGFSVIPLQPRSKMRLWKGKHPFDTWMPCDEHLRKWFCTPTPCGIAIVPGAVSGNLVIVDFDEHSIYDTWASLVPGACDLPCVRSARGVHVYLRTQVMPIDKAYSDGAFEGVVFGQVICRGTITAPPSVHPSGAVYQWQGDPRQIPTIKVLSEIGITCQTPQQAQRIDRPVTTVTVKRRDGQIRNPQAYVNAAIEFELTKIRQTPKGGGAYSGRNGQLYTSALKLGKYLDMISEAVLLQRLAQAAHDAGMTEAEDSITPTIRSGFRHNTQEVRR